MDRRSTEVPYVEMKSNFHGIYFIPTPTFNKKTTGNLLVCSITRHAYKYLRKPQKVS